MHDIKAHLSDVIIDHLRDRKPITLYKDVTEMYQRPLIEMTLISTDYNQTECAKVLGINRGTLRKKMAEYGINSRREVIYEQ